MAVGAAAVGATGKASFQLAERTVVAGNRAALWGALAVGGDGSLEIQLASGASVTDNVVGQVGCEQLACCPPRLQGSSTCRRPTARLPCAARRPRPPRRMRCPCSQIGVVALGGDATSTSTGDSDLSTTVEGNTRSGNVLTVQQQPAVATALNILLGSGEPGAAAVRGGCFIVGPLHSSRIDRPTQPCPRSRPTLCPLAAFKDGELSLPTELRKLQAQLCAALAAPPAVNGTAILPADLKQQVWGSAAVLGGCMPPACTLFVAMQHALGLAHSPAHSNQA